MERTRPLIQVLSVSVRPGPPEMHVVAKYWNSSTITKSSIRASETFATYRTIRVVIDLEVNITAVIDAVCAHDHPDSIP